MSLPLPRRWWDWLAVAVVILALAWPEVRYQCGRLRRWWRRSW
jgi:hypothetical protein